MELTTDRLFLREWEETDAARLFALAVNASGNEVVGTGDQHEQAHEIAAGLEIEEQADEEEIGIAQCLLPAEGAHGDQCEAGKDNGKEHPELELGEEQGRVGIEGEDLTEGLTPPRQRGRYHTEEWDGY